MCYIGFVLGVDNSYSIQGVGRRFDSATPEAGLAQLVEQRKHCYRLFRQSFVGGVDYEFINRR